MTTWLTASTLAAVLDAAPDALYLIDPETSTILHCNRAGHDDLGYTRHELLGQSVLNLQTDVIDLRHWALMAANIRHGSPSVSLSRHRHRDGHEVSVEVHASRVLVAGREVLVSVARNITGRVRLDADMLSRDAHVRFALNETSDGLWDWNIVSNEVFFSAPYKRMLGYGPNEMSPSLESWSNSLHPNDRAQVLQTLMDHASGLRERYEAEYRIKNRNGHDLWVHDRGCVCERDALGNPTRMVGMVQNITDHKAQQAQLLTLAKHDSLTGLLNRREGDETMLQLIRTCLRLTVPLGVCMLDIDHFKSINDTHGHAVGDQVLMRLTAFLSNSIRTTDVLYRWGGEEFVLMAPGLDAVAMVQWCNKLCAQVEALDWSDLLGERRVTASFGVAVMPYHGTVPSALVTAADSAMYVAKAQGRNQVCLATSPNDTTLRLLPLSACTD